LASGEAEVTAGVQSVATAVVEKANSGSETIARSLRGIRIATTPNGMVSDR
jgi:hypothetical protein